MKFIIVVAMVVYNGWGTIVDVEIIDRQPKVYNSLADCKLSAIVLEYELKKKHEKSDGIVDTVVICVNEDVQ